MTGLNWDYNQEQNDKISHRISQYSKEISQCDDNSVLPSIINSLYGFLLGIGYTERMLHPLRDSIHHHMEVKEKTQIVLCVNRLATDVKVCGVPVSKKNSPDISISNQNTQTNSINIDVVEKSFSDELTSEQLEQLANLIKGKKRGDLKKWFSDLGNSTLSGVLSTLCTSLPNLFQ